MNSDNAIELSRISLSYDIEVIDTEKRTKFNRKSMKKIKKVVLDDINLNVKKGEILGVIGVNGSGKSSLLSIIARITEPDTGSVCINGNVATILELGMGFHRDMTGRENILLKGELFGFSKTEMEEKTNQIIEYSGISEYIDNPVRTYSSGMKSRLAFSIMIHVNADIMLVDEILSTGDATFSIKASDYFRKILRDGKTVVFVSHAPGTIESLCTRAVWINNGKIIADGKPKKVCNLYQKATMESIDVIVDQAKSGLADAQYRLAMLYKEGNKVEKNDDAYHSWIKSAAEQGHIKAQVEYADYLINIGGEDCCEQALTYYQSAASRGDNSAKTKISKMLGSSTFQLEYDEVKYIFKYMAETRGSPVDLNRYASFLLKTAQTANDRTESLYWYKKVAYEYNHPDAIVQLATMYRDGVGTEKDNQKFIETLKYGATKGVIKATIMLADQYVSGTIIDENLEDALKLYEKCASLGSSQCQYNVAVMYLEGKGTKPDMNMSQYWFDEYAKTQLLQYQTTALSILETQKIPDSISISDLSHKIVNTNDEKSLAFLFNHYSQYELSAEELKMICNKLSNHFGKNALLSLGYFNNIYSVGYDRERSKKIIENNLYLGDSSLLYLFFKLFSEDGGDNYSNLCKKCLVIAAKNGHKLAIIECENRGIKIE